MKTIISIGKSAWLGVLLLVSWEAMSRFHLLDPLFFPPPLTLFAKFGSMTMSGEVGRQAARTLERTALGFGLGALVGTLASAFLSLSSGLRQASQPVISILYSTPRLTLL